MEVIMESIPTNPVSPQKSPPSKKPHPQHTKAEQKVSQVVEKKGRFTVTYSKETPPQKIERPLHKMKLPPGKYGRFDMTIVPPKVEKKGRFTITHLEDPGPKT